MEIDTKTLVTNPSTGTIYQGTKLEADKHFGFCRNPKTIHIGCNFSSGVDPVKFDKPVGVDPVKLQLQRSEKSIRSDHISSLDVFFL